jgi:glycosyltransferase involved in cell wall biosynthesis
MRVFNIIQCANLGGMEQANLALLASLKKRGHEVELLSLNPLGALKPLLAEHRIRAEGLAYRGRGGWRSLPQFRRQLARSRSDVLIMTGHNLLAMLALGDFCRGRRLLVMHFHHIGVKPHWQWRLIYRAALAEFSAVAFVSNFIRREAEAIYPPIAAISHTVGAAITLSEPASEMERMQARRELGLPAQARIVGNAGWLIPRKRFDLFLRVARNIAVEEPDTLFLIAGDGPEAASLRSLARELGIAERVRWLGWQSDLTSVYRALDLALFSTDGDALPRTPLEALGAGVPVVASAVNSGLSEILDDENYGFVVPSHDIEQLTRAALRVLRDGLLGDHLVRAARHRIGQVASVSGHTERVCRLLQLNDDARTGEAWTQ